MRPHDKEVMGYSVPFVRPDVPQVLMLHHSIATGLSKQVAKERGGAVMGTHADSRQGPSGALTPSVASLTPVT